MKEREAVQHFIVRSEIIHGGASMGHVGLVLATVVHQLGLTSRPASVIERCDGLIIAPDLNFQPSGAAATRSSNIPS